MARTIRPQHESPFERREDFNEQLYAAVRQSPWWMISLALHGLVFVAAGIACIRSEEGSSGVITGGNQYGAAAGELAVGAHAA